MFVLNKLKSTEELFKAYSQPIKCFKKECNELLFLLNTQEEMLHAQKLGIPLIRSLNCEP